MGVGLEVYNASGQKTFATSDYLGRFLGTFQTGTSNGSMTDANLSSSTNTPFFVAYSTSVGGVPPTIILSGTTISWSWDPSWGSATRASYLVLYGLR